MKIYYFLSHLDHTTYTYIVNKLNTINSVSDADNYIDKYYKKIGIPLGNDGTNKSIFIETVMFMKYIIKNNICSVNDLKFVHKKNFLLYNENLYELFDTSWKLIDDEVYFVTTRDSFNCPFFVLLYNFEKKLGNSKIHVLKPNFSGNRMYYDKINFLGKIYHERANLIGDIIVPVFFDISNKSIKSLLLFSKNNVGNEFVIKKNFGEMGKDIKLVSSDNITEDYVDYLRLKFFQHNGYSLYSSYIVSYYDIKKEYRVYYTYDKGQLKVYSIKNKDNNTPKENLMNLPSFGLYTHVSAEWSYMDPKDFENNDKLVSFVETVAKNVDLDTGVLEFCEEVNGELRFIEINQLGGSLMFPGKDTDMMKEFNYDIWDLLFSR